MLQTKAKRSLASRLSGYNPKKLKKKAEGGVKVTENAAVERSKVSKEHMQNDMAVGLKDQVNLQLNINNSTQVEEE